MIDFLTFALSKNYTKRMVGSIWPNWDTSTTYTQGQIVQKDNVPYQKKSGASTPGTWVASEWVALNLTEISNKADKDTDSQSFAIGYDSTGFYVTV